MTRRRIDAAVAAAIALIVVAAGIAVWWGSDARATTLIPAAQELDEPTDLDDAPARLTESWRAEIDPVYGAVVTPYGSVITGSEHAVVGLAATDGRELWRYTRTNRALCGIGSGDWSAEPLDSWSGVHGAISVFEKNGYCSQVTLHDPTTGERLFQRTGPGSAPGQLLFGEPYAGWFGEDYLELWRHDFVATIRYGNQPNPVNGDGPHLGCTFLDAAATTEQLATIEHCADGTNLVLNWPTPSDAPSDHGWDANHSEPKVTVPLGEVDAVIVGVTPDRVAVWVDGQVVGYDAEGSVVSRSTAGAASGVAGGSRTWHDLRFTFIEPLLITTSIRQVEVPDPDPEDSEDPENPENSEGSGDSEGEDADLEPATVAVDDPFLAWVADSALGLPAIIGDTALVPVAAGYEIRDLDTGEITGHIPVDRGDYRGRVDATAVGTMLIEQRGATVVALDAG